MHRNKRRNEIVTLVMIYLQCTMPQLAQRVPRRSYIVPASNSIVIGVITIVSPSAFVNLKKNIYCFYNENTSYLVIYSLTPYSRIYLIYTTTIYYYSFLFCFFFKKLIYLIP